MASELELAADETYLREIFDEVQKEAKKQRIRDAVDHEDFRANLDLEIPRISREMLSGRYATSGLLRADMAKSAYSERPIAIPYIEDAIVYHALARFIQNRVDPRLSTMLMSNRLRTTEEEIPGEDELPERLRDEEYWFISWPQFMGSAETLATQYKFALLLDVAVYFENIDYSILRALISKYDINDPRIPNLLLELLNAWAWRSPDGFSRSRGLPQSPDASSILGSLYLDPVDKILESILSKVGGKALRWMDGYKIFVNDFDLGVRVAREVGRAVRDLMLNLNESKTVLMPGPFKDTELVEIEFLFTTPGKEILEVATLVNRAKIKGDKAITRLRASLGSLWKDDDAGIWGRYTQVDLWKRPHLTDKVMLYLVAFPDRLKIASGILDDLRTGKCKSDYQEAIILRSLGDMHYESDDLRSHLWGVITNAQRHWYLRCQALYLMGKVGRASDLIGLKKIFEKLGHTYEKRYCVAACTRLDKQDREELYELGSTAADFRLSRLISYFRRLTASQETCRATLDEIHYRTKWNEYLYQLHLLRDFPSRDVQVHLRDQIAERQKHLADPVLKGILSDLQKAVGLNILRL